MLFLLMALLMGCAGLTSEVQVDLHGWANYLEYPVSVSDQELEAGTEFSAHQMETILWRQERCRLRGLSCLTEVRIFRNRHFGEGHLSTETVRTKLTEAGVRNVSVAEKLGAGPTSSGDACHVVVRILPE